MSSKFVTNTRLRVVFLTLFSVFGIVVKHSLSYLIYYILNFLSFTAFEVFKAGCPVPKCFVQKLISESVAKRAVQNLSVLFCGGWAEECDASCVPLDLVFASYVKNRKELVRILLQHNAHARGLPKSSKSPLSMCLQEGNLDLAVILLQHGADENDLMERNGESPFHASLRIGLKKGEKRNPSTKKWRF